MTWFIFQAIHRMLLNVQYCSLWLNYFLHFFKVMFSLTILCFKRKCYCFSLHRIFLKTIFKGKYKGKIVFLCSLPCKKSYKEKKKRRSENERWVGEEKKKCKGFWEKNVAFFLFKGKLFSTSEKTKNGNFQKSIFCKNKQSFKDVFYLLDFHLFFSSWSYIVITYFFLK